TTFTPTAAEITAGSATVTLTANANSPCTTDATSNATITIKRSPTTATVSPSTQTICLNGTTSALGGNAPTSGTGTWSIVTGGFTGTFNPDANTPNATFTQTGGGEGTCVLRWTISSPPCTPDSSADVTLTIGDTVIPVITLNG